MPTTDGGGHDKTHAAHVRCSRFARRHDLRQVDPLIPVQRRHRPHRPVRADRPDRPVQPREHALRLAQRVREHQARAHGRLVLPPPRVEIVHHTPLIRPSVDGQAEGALADERVTGHGLEGVACRVGVGLVVAADDAHASARPAVAADTLDPHLRRPEDVPRRVQRHADRAEFDRLSPRQSAHPFRRADAQPEHADAPPAAQVRARARRGVVRVRVRDDGPCDGLPGVDVKAALPAEQPLRGHLHKVAGRVQRRSRAIGRCGHAGVLDVPKAPARDGTCPAGTPRPVHPAR